MAKPTDLRLFNDKERKMLVDAIPLLREKDAYFWEQGKFMELYKQWISIPNNPYEKDGFEGFKMAISKARKMQPYMIKTQEGYALAKDALVRESDITLK